MIFLCKNVRRGLPKEDCRQGVCADCTRLVWDLGEFLLKLPIDKRGGCGIMAGGLHLRPPEFSSIT